MPSFKVRRTLPTAVFGASLVLCLGYLYLVPHELAQQSLLWPSSSTSPPNILPLPHQALTDLPIPDDYIAEPSASSFCADRFSKKYLLDMRAASFQYCKNNSYSSASSPTLTCFHSHTSSDDARDSLCLAQGIFFDPSAKKFVLPCDIVAPDADAKARGAIPFEAVRQYWYDTGPRYIFEKHVSFVPGNQRIADNKIAKQASTPTTRYTLLIKREGEGNLWHCLMEIWSMTMSMDVLRMARDPATGRAFWGEGVRVGGASETDDRDPNFQVVILDDRDDGPYFDLWKLFSGRPALRLAQLASDPAAASFYGLAGGRGGDDDDSSTAENSVPVVDHRFIVPLAGASNPVWQNDWTVRDCTNSETLRAFVGRVLRHYSVDDKQNEEAVARDADDQRIRVTFIDRKDANTRRLADQDRLLAALRDAYGNDTVHVEAVDFGALPDFAAQLRVARATDVLVGVHGAGLTHTMFLREQTSAVVEIQPADMETTYMGFRNLANMRGISYFRTHAAAVDETEWEKKAKEGAEMKMELKSESKPEVSGEKETATETDSSSTERRHLRPVRRAAWHTENFAIDTDVFVRAVGAAIEAVANKGVHQKEVL
ncbi:MAG: hypothetical protein STHCBS139747_008029 [Sporothrix thermara]